jgi:hypothetical protein
MNRFNCRPLFTLFSLWLGFTFCPSAAGALTAQLTPKEKAMPEAAYYTTEFAPMPDEVTAAVANGPIPSEDMLTMENINDLSRPGYLNVENGYCFLKDGTAFVAARTDFPHVTKDMVSWWFWWHALADVRYKIWCPGAHYAIGAKDTAMLQDKSLPPEERILNNPHYPVEDVGVGVMPMSIRFVTPETFGFDTTKFKEAGIEKVLCGIVGIRIFGLTIEHTYMCHVFRKKGDGLEIRSRFWLGKKLPSPLLRRLFINEQTALEMMLHCSEEYTHLGSFLPSIYAQFGSE